MEVRVGPIYQVDLVLDPPALRGIHSHTTNHPHQKYARKLRAKKKEMTLLFLFLSKRFCINNHAYSPMNF